MGVSTPRLLTTGAALVVEDNVIVAHDIIAQLEELGAKTVLTAYRRDDVGAILSSTTISVAVLDYHFSGGTIEPVADVLIKRNIPFIIASGVAKTQDLPARLRAIPLIVKPFVADDIRHALERLPD